MYIVAGLQVDIAAEKAVDVSDDILQIQQKKRRVEMQGAPDGAGDTANELHTPVVGVVPEAPAGTNYVV